MCIWDDRNFEKPVSLCMIYLVNMIKESRLGVNESLRCLTNALFLLEIHGVCLNKDMG